MRWFGVGLVLFIILILCTRSASMTVEDAKSHLVFIANADGVGSGIIVADGYVMTCAHLIPKNHKVQVYAAPTKFDKHNPMAEVVYVNQERDVALLKVPWVRGYVTFGHVYLDQEVIEVGYTAGQPFVFHGRVCRIDTGIAEVDMSASFGASGSGVYDVHTGELVGMVDYLRILGPVGAPTVIGVIPADLLSVLMEYTKPSLL